VTESASDVMLILKDKVVALILLTEQLKEENKSLCEQNKAIRAEIQMQKEKEESNLKLRDSFQAVERERDELRFEKDAMKARVEDILVEIDRSGLL